MLSNSEIEKQILNDTIKDNTPYDYRDYICVFENAGYEIPPEYFGLSYTSSSNFSTRKNICESQTRDAGAEGGIYIKRSDWIDPTNKDIICGIFDIQGVRLQTDKGDKRQFSSKQLCDIYNNPKPDPKNPNNIIISKVIPSDIINPITDYDKKQPPSDDNKSIEVRYNVIIICIIISIILYIFYILKFQTEKPYKFYDITKSLLLNKIILILFFVGFYIYFMCPNGTCYHELLTPNIRKNTDFESSRILCDNMKNFRAKRSNEIINTCDTMLNYSNYPINTCNNLLYSVGINRSIYNNIYSSFNGCNGCNVQNTCIQRYGNHIINYLQKEDNSYTKYCILCNKIFCSDNQCYPGKDAYYSDDCPKNNVIEHVMQVKEYKKDKVIMICQYCKQECEIIP